MNRVLIDFRIEEVLRESGNFGRKASYVAQEIGVSANRVGHRCRRNGRIEYASDGNRRPQIWRLKREYREVGAK